jgi:hypothetical protein
MESPRVEHVNAMAWLNQSSSAAFYMVKIEAVRIGSSDVAPLMTLIVGPSDETKIITEEKQEFAARYGERKKFWEGLLQLANTKTQLHAGRSPSKDSWIAAGSGKRGIEFTYAIRQHDVQVEVWIARGSGQTAENKMIFDTFLAKKDEIERVFGGPLEWQRLDEKEGSRIRAVSNLGGYRDPDAWPQVHEWMANNMVALERAFRPQINALQI